MEDAPIEEKQAFLRENILEKGYDINLFVNFLKSKKGEEGEDIGNWTLRDLRSVVNEFTANYISQPEQIESENNLQDDINNNQEDTKMSKTVIINKKKKNLLENNNDESENIEKSRATTIIKKSGKKNDKDFEFGLIVPDTLPCKKCETTELSNVENIEIIVGSPKKVEGGFFTKSYLTLAVSTNPLNFAVRRRYYDFYWLREKLLYLFNTHCIPRLPKNGKMDGEFYLNKRIRNLEKFLNYLIKDPVIKSSQILFDFLTIESDDEFIKKKKVYDRMKVNNDIYNKKEENGLIKVKVNQTRENYYDNIKNNVTYNVTALKKLNTNFKYLKNEIQIVIDRFISISAIFNKLYRISKTYLDDSTITESYNLMEKMFKNWAENFKSQNLFINTDIKEYYKFISGNFLHIKELTKNVDIHRNEYYKLSKNLIAKKAELYQKGDVARWELDPNDRKNLDLIRTMLKDKIIGQSKICAKETKNAINVKKVYGYYLNKIIGEYERIRHINGIMHKEKVMSYCKKQSLISSEFYKVLCEIMAAMDSCVNGPDQQKEIEQKEEKVDNDENNIQQENNNIINTNEEGEKIQEEIKDDEKKENNEGKKEEEKKEESNETNKENESQKEEKKTEEEKTDNKNEKEEKKDEEKKEEEKVEEKKNEEKKEEEKKDEEEKNDEKKEEEKKDEEKKDEKKEEEKKEEEKKDEKKKDEENKEEGNNKEETKEDKKE